jgi:hypothetical protein
MPPEKQKGIASEKMRQHPTRANKRNKKSQSTCYLYFAG